MNTLQDAICILCGEVGLEPIGKKPRDWDNSEIAICKRCNHIQMSPLLSPEEEREEYDNDYSLRFGKVKLADGSDFETMRIKFSEWAQEHVNLYFDELQNFKSVLEIGAGYGFFMEALNACPQKKFNIEGIEIGKFRLDNFVGGTVHNINVLTDDVPAELCNKYECVIFMHLLEHISQPIRFLKSISAFLKPGGRIICEVPNINCFLGEISPAYKDFMYMKEHCSYFSSDTLRMAFENAGYQVNSIDTYELYSIENHCHWIREGIPFTMYNQMFMPDGNLEWINRIYKSEIGKQGKGFALTICATVI